MKRMYSPAVLLTVSALVFLTPKLVADVGTGAASASPLTISVSSTIGLGPGLTTSATSSISDQPLATVSGLAPSVFSSSGGPSAYLGAGAAATVTIPAVAGPPLLTVTSTSARLSASALSNSVNSDVDGLSGSKTTQAAASISDLNLSFGVLDAAALGSPLISSLETLKISATTVSASTEVSGAGTGGPFSASYTRSVAGIDITVFGVSILSFFGAGFAADLLSGADVDVTLGLAAITGITLPPALTSLTASGSLRIYNSGTSSADNFEGSASASALRIDFDNVLIGATVVSGTSSIPTQTSVTDSIDTTQTSSSQSVPEPSMAALIALGAGILGLHASRRRSARVSG